MRVFKITFLKHYLHLYLYWQFNLFVKFVIYWVDFCHFKLGDWVCLMSFFVAFDRWSDFEVNFPREILKNTYRNPFIMYRREFWYEMDDQSFPFDQWTYSLTHKGFLHFFS